MPAISSALAARVRDEAQVLAVGGMAVNWDRAHESLLRQAASVGEAHAAGFIAGAATALGMTPDELLQECAATW